MSRSGRGHEQGLQILERNPFLAWVNCLQGGGMHPGATGEITDPGHPTFHSDISSVAFFSGNLWRVGTALGGGERRWGTANSRAVPG